MTIGTKILAITNVLAIIGAFVIAIFKIQLSEFFLKPKFDLSIEKHKTKGQLNDGNLVDMYYWRIWIENKGKSKAKNVQIQVSSLQEKGKASDQLEKVNSFCAIDLLWSYSRKNYNNIILPNMGKHCDFFHVIKSHDNNKIIFDFEYITNINGVCNAFYVGKAEYEIEIKIAAENVKPMIKKLKLNDSGNWFDEESKMYSDGISIEIL